MTLQLVECSSQAEVDAAVAVGDIVVVRQGLYVVGGSATVEAGGSATVRAGGSATVEAWGSATVEAWGSATVRAWGSATVEAWGSATVRAWGSATVRAWGSATVEAWDSATVEAWGSATVRAWGSATVRAWDSATVRATPYVACHIDSDRATVTGGVQIRPKYRTPADWTDYHGITTATDDVRLYKAVRDDYKSLHGFRYEPGTTVEAPDWNNRAECGGGLHLVAQPWRGLSYDPDATRYVEVAVDLADIVVIDASKVKARRVTVVREVDLDGNPIDESSS